MICKSCKKEQGEEFFEVCSRANGKIYRRKLCNTCRHAQKRERYYKIKKWFLNYKKGLKCSECGNSDYRVITFHHIKSDTKEHNISEMVSMGFSTAIIQKEIEKCIPLCANCHLIKHFDEEN